MRLSLSLIALAAFGWISPAARAPQPGAAQNRERGDALRGAVIAKVLFALNYMPGDTSAARTVVERLRSDPDSSISANPVARGAADELIRGWDQAELDRPRGFEARIRAEAERFQGYYRDDEALDALANSDPDPVPKLGALFSDEDWRVHWLAFAMLERLLPKSPRALSELIDRDPDLENLFVLQAVQKFGRGRADLVPRLRELLTCEHPRPAIVALGALGLAAADAVPDLMRAYDELPPMVDVSRRFSSSMHEECASFAIQDDIVDALGNIAARPDIVVPFLRGLMHADEWRAVRAARALANFDAGTANEAIAWLLDRLHPYTTPCIASRLGDIGPRAAAAIPCLAEGALEGDDDRRRAVYVRALARVGGDQDSVVDVLARVLCDERLYEPRAPLRPGEWNCCPEPGLGGARTSALRALMYSRNTGAVAALAGCVEQSQEDTAGSVVNAISQLGERAAEAKPAALRMLDDPALRSNGVWLLGEMGMAARGAIPRLEALYRDELVQTEQGEYALGAMAKIGGWSDQFLNEVVDRVLMFANTTEGECLKRAPDMILRIAPRLIRELRNPARCYAAMSLLRETDIDFDILVSALLDAMRAEVASYLAERASPRSSTSEPETWLCFAPSAEHSLAQLGPRALPPLIRFLSE